MTSVVRLLAGPPLRLFRALICSGFIVITRVVDRFLPEGDGPAPIFIIGAPRTGSTILYQALSNSLDVLYIDNVVAKLYQNLFLGFLISKFFYKDRPHNNFNSRHGDTGQFGGRAPNECGAFWYQWLPADRHFIDHDEISQRHVEQLRFAVTFPSKWFAKPILFKNLNAGQRLRLIAKAFPGARIIYLKRNIDETVASILKARRSIGFPANKIWSVRPKDYLRIQDLSEEEMCREQVRLLQAQIEEDIALFPDRQVVTLHYCDLSASVIEELRLWIGVQFREGHRPTQFRTAVVQAGGETS